MPDTAGRPEPAPEPAPESAPRSDEPAPTVGR